MERLKAQLAQVAGQLSALTASQRMLVGTLAAVLVATIVWWTSLAAGPERVALLEQPMTPRQLGQVRQTLSSRGIGFAVEGDRIVVDAAARDEAMAVLSYERALPSDTTRHFEAAIGQMGSFDPRQKIDLTILAAKQDSLSDQIRRWPGVRAAKVLVNGDYKRQIGGDVLPTAAVTIETDGAGDARTLADSAGRLVAGAFPMMKPAAVSCVVDGHFVDAGTADPLAGGGGRLLELRAQAEAQFERKLRNTFAYIDGLHVSVSATVDAEARRVTQRTVDPDGKVSVPVETRTERDGSTDAAPDAGGWGEGGFRPNVGATAAAGLVAAAAGAVTDTEIEETRSVVEFSSTVEERYSTGGEARPTGCTLSLPVSYVVADWQARTKTTDSPSPEVLREYDQQLRTSLAGLARRALGLGEDAVTVMTYADATAGSTRDASFADPAAASAATSVVGGLVGEYGKTALALALAAAALAIVGGAMRKTTVAGEGNGFGGAFGGGDLLTAGGDGDVTLVGGDDAVAGEAAGADPLLVGQEVAEDHLRAGQMVEQVQSLVKENPDAAAALVKRWLAAGN